MGKEGGVWLRRALGCGQFLRTKEGNGDFESTPYNCPRSQGGSVESVVLLLDLFNFRGVAQANARAPLGVSWEYQRLTFPGA